MQAATGPLISLSPSFNTYSSSDRLAQIAARVVSELTAQDPQLAHDSDWENLYDLREEEKLQEQPRNNDVAKFKDEEGDDEEFEFAFVCKEQHASPISADEIFSNGQIRPTVFPLFNQDLLLSHNDVVSSQNINGDSDAVENSKSTTVSTKQRRLPLRMLMIEEERETASCSSSEADDLENLPPGTYCVWAPPKASPVRHCNKSGSTGSSKRWKFKDLLYRSSSDGKDTFVFLAPSTKRADKNNKGDDVARKTVDGPKEERFIVRSRAVKEGDKRRSFMPYRQDLVGFFSNVNGLSRNLHPF